MRRLTVVCTDRCGCHVALHRGDSSAIFGASASSRHFCRALRLTPGTNDSTSPEDLYVGWVGDAALDAGTLEVAQAFAVCLGVREGEEVQVAACPGVPIAESVMVQPGGSDDWEVVELQAAYLIDHLLGQVAVLTPGMVFPVWIHGQVAARLRVDPKDSNRDKCFLLDLQSDLVIESRARAVGSSKPVSIFGGGSGDVAETFVRLRVFGVADDLDAPAARVHKMDLEELACGVALPGGCLAWLSPSCSGTSGAAMSSRDNASASVDADASPATNAEEPDRRIPMLLRVEASDDVPRRHVVLPNFLVEAAWIRRFGLVRLTRCRQVAVWAPHVTLTPVAPSALLGGGVRGSARGASDDEERRWLVRLFEGLVRRYGGELCLADGTLVRLRSSDDAGALEGAAASKTSRASPLPPGWLQAALAPTLVSGSGETKLGVGQGRPQSEDDLSELDIDDIYAKDSSGPPSPRQEDYVSYQVDEVDLGLDDETPWSCPEKATESSLTKAASSAHGQECPSMARPLLARPATVTVRVRLAVGAARRGEEDLVGPARLPPFVRVSNRSLAASCRVSVVLAPGSLLAKREEEHLTELWAAVPGLRPFPEQPGSDVLELVEAPADGQAPSTPLDGVRLFAEAASALRAQLLAQLGQRIGGEAAMLPEEAATAAQVVGAAVPGATTVIGAHGSGKTLLCRRICAELSGRGVVPLSVSCARLGQPGRKFKSVLAWIRSIFQFACWYSPCVVFFDDFGALCPDVEQGAPNLSVAEERSIIVAELLSDILREVRASGAFVAVLTAAHNDTALHHSLWRAEVLEHKVVLRLPQLKERPEILRILCRVKAESEGWDVDPLLLEEEGLSDWGGRVDGFGVSDLAQLVDRACIEATADSAGMGSRASVDGENCKALETRCGHPTVSLKHLERAVAAFVPSAMADQTFLTSDTRMADVGGLDNAKQALMDMLTMPTKYAALVDRAPVRLRRGLMLVGPPGCGKTMLVNAAACETRGLLRFLTVKGPELLSKYIGASEAGVRQVFERAAAAAPSVIFFDEIESLAPKRGADSTGVTDRVVNQMLCYLDGVEDRGRVYVVAATGRPDLVDAALMRPGRFDKICLCDLPSDEEKFKICEILMEKYGVHAVGPSETPERESVNSAAQLRRLVSRLPQRFTSADVGALFSSAKVEALNEAINGRSSGNPQAGPVVVSFTHLFTALSSAKASVSEADERRYAQIFAPYKPSAGSTAGGGSGNGAGVVSGSTPGDGPSFGGPGPGPQMRQKVALA
eukprot:TRINITY_DN43391_c0_g1_i1.p1 TRINITY_DN43391_c0_g1~~TRINITY_DN43391_c0_g1_i1.p1  ORF type:complete len:1268 (-),score=228.11 TRINITY_DN43391_c0_g1_i1:72-3875(-)